MPTSTWVSWSFADWSADDALERMQEKTSPGDAAVESLAEIRERLRLEERLEEIERMRRRRGFMTWAEAEEVETYDLCRSLVRSAQRSRKEAEMMTSSAFPNIKPRTVFAHGRGCVGCQATGAYVMLSLESPTPYGGDNRSSGPEELFRHVDVFLSQDLAEALYRQLGEVLRRNEAALDEGDA